MSRAATGSSAGGRPAFARAEHVEQPVGLVVGVALRSGCMRTWQRSAMASIDCPPVLEIPMRAPGSVPPHIVRRHVQHVERHIGGGGGHGSCTTLRWQPCEEPVDEVACLCAAIESPPQQPKTADELVAGIDGHQEGLRVGCGIVGHADQQSFDVVGDQAHPRITARRGPRRHVQFGLGGAGRARVEGDSAVQSGVAEEERDANRNLQRLPLPPPEPEVREATGSGRVPRGSADSRWRR